MTRRRALFLDRDGVVNHDAGYTYEIAQIRFIDGLFDMARLARALAFELVIATNQSGIARGYYSEDQFRVLSAWMERRFADEQAPLTGIYFCPDHPDGNPPYRRASPLRKPEPGMLLQAAQEHDLDLSRSVMVGDKESDIVAGRRAGVAASVLFGVPALPAGSEADVAVADHAGLAAWLTATFGDPDDPE